jgi:Na+-transporting NADH:ubiquinone oxidoreductase subunit NqrF
VDRLRSVPTTRQLASVLTAAALFFPAACGQSDVDKAKNEVQDAADNVKGDLNDVSKKDLENALSDAQDAAKNGSADTKRKARELQRKIERELNSRK